MTDKKRETRYPWWEPLWMQLWRDQSSLEHDPGKLNRKLSRLIKQPDKEQDK